MDEFDATIFDKKYEIESLLKYQTSKYLIGFTGSGIEKSEQHLLKTLFKSVFIEYPSS